MPDDKPIYVGNRSSDYPAPVYAQPPSLSDSDLDSEEAIHLLDYWHVIVARRWTILAILVTVVTVTMVATLRQVPIYQAEVTIQIDREDPNILTFKSVYEIDSIDDDSLQTQYKVLASRSLARRVVENMQLNTAKEFLPGEPGFVGSYLAAVRSLFSSPEPAPEAGEPDRIRPFVDRYISRLKVNPVLQARLVKVTFDAKDPVVAAQVINAHARHFIEQNLQFKYEATEQASSFLSEKLVELKANLEKAEDRLQQYSRENEILFTEEGRNTSTEKLKQLEEEFTRAQSDRFQKESYFRLLSTGNLDTLPQVVSNSLLVAQSTRSADLRREESELAVTFGPDYPRRRRLQSQLEETERTIVSEKERISRAIRTDYEAAKERERLLGTALEEQRGVVNRINQEIIQYNILKREADSNKQLYDGLLTRLKEAGISASLRASNIRVVDPAEVPTSPIRPQKALNLSLSLVVGLVFGVGIAFLQEYLDNTIKTAQDVNRYLGLPVLGTIPKLQSITGRRGYRYGYRERILATAEPKQQAAPTELVTHTEPTSLMSEAYRSLRTSLLLSSPGHPPRTVLVTSAVPSEGKTMTAVNTAISLTQTGARTVLVDGDMRKPRVHSIFGIQESPGLSGFLTGASTLKDAIHETAVPNLFVIPCGPIPPNPGELVLSGRFQKMMTALSEYFDYIILDSPPLSNVSDARVLGSACEGTILVIKVASTSRHMAKRGVQALLDSRARVSGVALNDLDVNANAGYYAYYTGHYYHQPYQGETRGS